MCAVRAFKEDVPTARFNGRRDVMEFFYTYTYASTRVHAYSATLLLLAERNRKGIGVRFKTATSEPNPIRNMPGFFSRLSWCFNENRIEIRFVHDFRRLFRCNEN